MYMYMYMYMYTRQGTASHAALKRASIIIHNDIIMIT